MRKLKSRMLVRYKVNIVFQFHASTACDSDDVVDVSLVQLRYKTLVLACYLASPPRIQQKDKHSLGPSYCPWRHLLFAYKSPLKEKALRVSTSSARLVSVLVGGSRTERLMLRKYY